MADYIEEPKVDISKFKSVNNSFRKKRCHGSCYWKTCLYR